MVLVFLASYSNLLTQELTQNNYVSDSIFEATKGLPEKDRAKEYLDLVSNRNLSENEILILTDSVIQLALAFNNKDWLYQAYYLRSKVWFNAKKYDSAFLSLGMTKALIKKKDWKKQIEVALLSGQILYKQNQSDTAEIIINKGLENIDRVDDSAWVATIYLKLGRFYMKVHGYHRAIESYKNALKYCPARPPTELFLFTSYNNMGICNSRTNDYQESLENLMMALNYIEPSSPKVGKVYTTIGIIYGNLLLYDKSMEYFMKAKNVYAQEQDTVKLIAIYTNIGSAFTQVNNYDLAIQNYKEALTFIDKAGHESQKIPVLANMAMLYNDIKQPDSALYFLRQVEKNPSLAGNKRYLGYIMNLMGSSMMLKGNFDMAIDYLEKTQTIAGEVNDRALLQSACEKLSENYENKKNYPKALQYFQEAVAIKDSIASNEYKVKIEEILANHDLEVKEKENEILQQNLTIKQQKISRQKTAGIGITLFALLLTISLFVAFYIIKLRSKALFQSNLVNQANVKIYQQEKQLADEQAKKQDIKLNSLKDIASKTTSEILKSSEMSSRLLKEFNDIKPLCLNSQAGEMINKTLAEFSGLTVENNWGKFYSDFKVLHPTFFKKIEEQGFNLTESEQRLAAFIKMDLRTKDIAPITFQSINAINVAKSRLKNKLHFDTIEEMQQSFKQL